jgi:hypothetical protein
MFRFERLGAEKWKHAPWPTLTPPWSAVPAKPNGQFSSHTPENAYRYVFTKNSGRSSSGISRPKRPVRLADLADKFAKKQPETALRCRNPRFLVIAAAK